MITTVDASGTPVRLAPAMRGTSFLVVALSDNTGTVYLSYEEGTPKPLSESERVELFNGPVASTKEGIPLDPGAEIVLAPPVDIWWIDAATSGDSVDVTPIGF